MKKPWLKGGLIGIAICLALFPFYIFIYAPLFMINAHDLSPWTLVVPAATGHILPLIANFFAVYGVFCPRVEPICTAWAVNSGCVNQDFTFTQACAQFSSSLFFWVTLILLFAIYFLIGAYVAKKMDARQKTKIKHHSEI